MAEILKYKTATEPWEIEQINKLNYETFVEEIPQHTTSTDGVLVDKFHQENTYIICVNGEKKILGMLAVRGKRPFSLDQKVADMDKYLPPGRTMCEVRLLAARRTARHSRVVHGLIKEVVSFCLGKGYDLALISGYVGQLKFYKHMGFIPFGPVVGSGSAQYQPMYLTPEAYSKSKKPAIPIEEMIAKPKVYLLPGPVQVTPSVKAAFAQSSISHRSKEFMEVHADLQARLCDLVNARNVEIFMGSGTLANNVVAAQLSLLNKKGLVLSNGEFGNRLIECARGFGLDFKVLQTDWGRPFERQAIERILECGRGIGWVWAVHHETSTGMLNDINMLREMCAARDIKLCLDCVSSVGCVEVDLSGVYLASAVSGKGLRSFAGLGLVFYNYTAMPADGKIPCYFDLGYYHKCQGVPFTINSNLVYALYTSIQGIDIEARQQKSRELYDWLCERLGELGLEVFVKPPHVCPNVLTIAFGDGLSAEKIGDALTEGGYSTSYRSSYLLRRNWLQICLMSEFSIEALEPLVGHLKRLIPDGCIGNAVRV